MNTAPTTAPTTVPPAEYQTRRYDLRPVADPRIAAMHAMLDGTPAAAKRLRAAIDATLGERSTQVRRLWAYYQNPGRRDSSLGDSGLPYRQAQEWGMPARLTGYAGGDEPFGDVPVGLTRKEVVIENDIGWRIDTIVDFLFGRPLVLDSDAADPARREVIGELLRHIFAGAGGLAFLQQIALVGAVCGSVDVLVKVDAQAANNFANGNFNATHGDGVCDTTSLGGAAIENTARTDLGGLASLLRLELVEPGRALPILDPHDASRLCAYAQVYQLPRSSIERPATERSDWIRRVWSGVTSASTDAEYDVYLEVIGARGWQLWRNEELIDSGHNPIGVVPAAHVQNIVRPFRYEGGGDVEPLIPLQDELNTRLSDRANRVALQAMKMYLGVGIDGFDAEPVQPGRMWTSENPDARVVEFGGESSSPGEGDAIRDAREALDKASGVNPVASGAIRNRVGNLTSAAALRLTFGSLLARTERKRANYGRAINRVCELALAWLDAAGLFATTPDERRVRLTWPDPLPVDVGERLEQARQKQALGIDPDVIRRELGY